MRIDYFIYYRIRIDCSDALAAALATMQASLQAATGIRGRYRRRVDDPCTWMEIYEGVSDARQFEIELGSHAQRHGLHQFLVPGSALHIERFRVV